MKRLNEALNVEALDDAGDEARDDALIQFLYLAPIGLIELRADGTIEMCNPLSAQLLMPIAIGGRLDNLFEILGPHAPQLRQTVERFADRSGVICQAMRLSVPHVDRPDVPRIYALHLTKIDHDRMMAVVSDVTLEADRERIELGRQLHDAARVDRLTAMPNRIAMRELIDRALVAPVDGAHGAVLLIGGERLQELAENFGEPVRDEVFNVMGLRLNAALRPSDCVGCAGDFDQIAARGSGDDFLVLLQRMSDPADAVMVAQRVLEALARPYAIGNIQLHVSLSVGVVPLGDRTDDADAVLRDGAIALTQAKRAGGSRWVWFQADMRSQAIRRGHLELELRDALARDELFVVYQPVVDLGDDRSGVAGVEALVRWQHPNRGIVSPIEFIAIAEDIGLIDALGQRVLEIACRDFMRWQADLGDRAPRMLAVNLSRGQLGDAALVDSVRTIVAAAGMPFERLQLEVTESLAAQDDGVQGQLQALKRLGLKLALDDFGTGYSSLSSLHLLPVDTVKIDRSFVTLLESSPHHRVLIEATIRVSRSLGMTTVAEGIETAGQASIVRELGCDKAQGYHFSRPVGEAALREWLAMDGRGT